MQTLIHSVATFTHPLQTISGELGWDTVDISTSNMYHTEKKCLFEMDWNYLKYFVLAWRREHIMPTH